MDVNATDLATALGITVPALLLDADRMIEETFKAGGHDAIEGMTTRVKGTGVTVSPKLAEALRRTAATRA